ncbi:MAG: DEAD/DEAH box helicase, partial [Pseudonocardiaceae bacterium]
TLSRRTANALGELGELREHHRSQVSDGRTVLEHSAAGHLHWWTWAGTAANRTLHTSLPALVDPRQCLGDRVIPMRADLDTRELSAALDETDPADLGHPPVTDAAVSGLKFSAALPPSLAQATIAARLADQSGAASALADDRIILHSG